MKTHKDLQARIDRALQTINALVYYDSKVSLETKTALLQVISVLTGVSVK